MQGTGTQENPYIIMNADDLYSMETTGSNESYFSLGADIDFNNTQYAENFVPIPLVCKKFIGNGHVIRNINYSVTDRNASIFTVSGDTDGTDITIEGLRTENIRLAGKKSFVFGITGGKCSISILHCTLVVNDMSTLDLINASSSDRFCLMHDNNITVSADYCTLVLNAHFYKMHAAFLGDTISHSQMRIEINTGNVMGSGNNYNAICSGSSVSDSYFFLKVNSRSTTSAELDFSSADSIFNRTYAIFQEIKGFKTIYWYGRIGSLCFYDKDVLAQTISHPVLLLDSSYVSNLYNVSTENCKNPVYLRSIGFECMGADE